jgi:acyl-CoA reductase-like NAD-dependent aldehyde dehydrogenase
VSKYKMLIGGELVEAKSGKTFPVINPATGEEFDRIPMGDQREVDKAVAAARKAFLGWSRTPIQRRAEALRKIAAAIREKAEELTRLDCLNHGTPISSARFGTMAASFNFERAAALSQSLDLKGLDLDYGLAYIHRQPFGVCALITPWNGPLMIAADKMSSALIMGNTCVLKPPSIDSATSLVLGEIIAGLSDVIPSGVVNIITGSGEVAGNALASHPGINMVSFTGSSEAGKSIMTAAGKTVKKLCLELGGKNPFIVMEDANIDAAADEGVRAQTENTGQVCVSPGRYYVHEKVHDEFVAKYIAGAKKVTVGDPFNPGNKMGPVVSEHHRNSIEAHIKSAIDAGAKLALGQLSPLPKPLDKGYYVLPTVITGVTPEMRVYREEIFGPVACIIKYSAKDDVVAMANDNNYGLAASVWTKDIEKGIKAAHSIESGMVWVNAHMFMMGLPGGGVKESGIGKEIPDEYCQKNSIYVRFAMQGGMSPGMH